MTEATAKEIIEGSLLPYMRHYPPGTRHKQIAEAADCILADLARMGFAFSPPPPPREYTEAEIERALAARLKAMNTHRRAVCPDVNVVIWVAGEEAVGMRAALMALDGSGR